MPPRLPMFSFSQRALRVLNEFSPGSHIINDLDYAYYTDKAIGDERWDLATTLIARGIFPTSDGADFAALHGNLAFLQRLHEDGIARCSSCGANNAAKNGDLETIYYLRTLGIHCSVSGADLAARKGHIHVIQDLREHGIHCTTRNGANLAAQYGHLEVVHDLREHDIHCTDEGADLAARNGHIHVIQDLREHGIHCTTYGVRYAMSRGHVEISLDLLRHGIECTRYILEDTISYCKNAEIVKLIMGYHEHHVEFMNLIRPLAQIPTDVACANTAAAVGCMEIVLDLWERGVYVTSGGLCRAITHGHIDMVRFLMERGVCATSDNADRAARSGNIHMLRLLREFGVKCSSRGAEDAAEFGHLDVLRELRADGIHVITSWGADAAAMCGHLNVVRYLRQNGIHVSSHSVESAIAEGHLDVVRDVVESGEGRESGEADGAHKSRMQVAAMRGVIDRTAMRGAIHVLEYLRVKFGLLCSRRGANNAAASGQLGTVQYLRHHGIHCTEDGAYRAASYGHIHILQDLYAHGIKCSKDMFAFQLVNHPEAWRFVVEHRDK